MSPLLIIPFCVIGGAIPFVVMATIYRRYPGLGTWHAYLLALGAVLGAAALGGYRVYEINSSPVRGDDLAVVISTGAVFLLPLVFVPFLAKLYLTWIGGRVTDMEKAPGLDGIRAWLRGGNLACVVLIAVCFWRGFGYSFWGVAGLGLMALLAFPMLTLAMSSAPPPEVKSESLSPERERVLKMLDDGKINAQESAELLNALGHSVPPPPVQRAAPALAHRKMVWIGLAMLGIGFFLPWFVIDPQKMMSEAMGRLPVPRMMSNLGGMIPQQPSIYVAGGDIEHSLGWGILLLGVLAAALPYAAANIDSQTCQKICLVALGVGAIILIYLFTQNIRFASVGILLGLAGYVLEFIGVLKERRIEWRRAA